MTRKLLHPKEVSQLLLQRYNNQHKAWLLSEGRWPLSLSLGIPTEDDVANDAAGVRRWVEAWASWSAPGTVSWISRQWPRLGTQKIPATLELASPHDVASILGHARRWKTVEQRYRQLVERWPQLLCQSVVGKHFTVLADYPDEDFSRLISMLDWLQSNPESGLAPRQLPVSGLDTKWLEKRTGLITDFLRCIVNKDTTGDFYAVCGLRRPPTRIRMHVLCPRLRQNVGGLRDIESPVSELAQLPLRPQHVLIIENLETGLALPDMDGTVAFMRLGNAVSVLAELPWVPICNIVYWGDIDTHGYAILNRARSLFPSLTSVLMDEKTFLAYRNLWVVEGTQCPEASLPLLTEEELPVFDGLKNGLWGSMLRLEQERIPWRAAIEILAKTLGIVNGSVEYFAPPGNGKL